MPKTMEKKEQGRHAGPPPPQRFLMNRKMVAMSLDSLRMFTSIDH